MALVATKKVNSPPLRDWEADQVLRSVSVSVFNLAIYFFINWTLCVFWLSTFGSTFRNDFFLNLFFSSLIFVQGFSLSNRGQFCICPRCLIRMSHYIKDVSIDQFPYIKIHTWLRGFEEWNNRNVFFITEPQDDFFYFILQASQPSMNFNIYWKWSIDRCQNRAFAYQHNMTASRAQVSTHLDLNKLISSILRASHVSFLFFFQLTNFLHILQLNIYN